MIVGAGLAGFFAAVHLGRFRCWTLLIGSGEGRWTYRQHNENYLGCSRGVSARHLHILGVAQAARFRVTCRADASSRLSSGLAAAPNSGPTLNDWAPTRSSGRQGSKTTAPKFNLNRATGLAHFYGTGNATNHHSHSGRRDGQLRPVSGWATFKEITLSAGPGNWRPVYRGLPRRTGPPYIVRPVLTGAALHSSPA